MGCIRLKPNQDPNCEVSLGMIHRSCIWKIETTELHNYTYNQYGMISLISSMRYPLYAVSCRNGVDC